MPTKGESLKAGMIFGELTLIMRVRSSTRGTFNLRKKWRAKCSCGAHITVPEFYFCRPQPKQHCGQPIHYQTLQSTHKEEYGIWYMMRQRCYNPEHVGYKHYGARGIRICDEWLNNFAAFLDFVGPRPSPHHTIDRVDPDGWYQPFQADGTTRQVRWATWTEQNNNKREHKKS